MKLKIFAVLIGSYVVIFLMTFFQSCELWKPDVTICNLSFAGINANNNLEPDDLTQEIGFGIYADDNCPSAINIQNIGFTSVCFGMTKCKDWQNQLVESSYSMSFDRDVIFYSDTIFANTDILKITNLRNGITITINEECKFITSTIIFSKDLSDHLLFGLDVYNVTFKCKTTDGIEFEKHRKVIFRK